MAEHTCEDCERRVQSPPRCEKCKKESEYLVKACMRFPAKEQPKKFYKGEIAYDRDGCADCGNTHAAWQNDEGQCEYCATPKTVTRPGIICPECAHEEQHYCRECAKQVMIPRPSLKCVSCELVEDYVPVTVSKSNSIRLNKCIGCGFKKVTDASGECIDCYRTRMAKRFYAREIYLRKCKKCANPAMSNSSYCVECSIKWADCIFCPTPVKTGQLTCTEHHYTCKACNEDYDPKGFDSLICNGCKEHSDHVGECAKCDAQLHEGNESLERGLCNNCYDGILKNTTCRRCAVTKGSTVCPECFDKTEYLCMRCNEVKVHAIDMVCTSCKVPY